MDWRKLLAEALVKYGPLVAEAIVKAFAKKIESEKK